MFETRLACWEWIFLNSPKKKNNEKKKRRRANVARSPSPKSLRKDERGKKQGLNQTSSHLKTKRG